MAACRVKIWSIIERPFLNPAWASLRTVKSFIFRVPTDHSPYNILRHTNQQWGAADAEIKVPSVKSTELKGSPFKAWSRSVYSHTCYAYCKWFFPCLFLTFWSIHLHFFQNLSWLLQYWLWLIPVPVLARRIKQVTHPVGCRFPVLGARGIEIG